VIICLIVINLRAKFTNMTITELYYKIILLIYCCGKDFKKEKTFFFKGKLVIIFTLNLLNEVLHRDFSTAFFILFSNSK
jgi:hypothetical protein